LAEDGSVREERRAHPRFPLILAVQYASAESILEYTEDLSAGGLLIRTDREFALGERVTLVVSFPQLIEPVELEVEVVRKRPCSAMDGGAVAVRVPPERHEDRARLAAVARTAGARGREGGIRVLLVDDNALVAAMYSAALRRLCESDELPPIGVEVAGDGAAAFDRLLREPPIDLLVTDVYMPVLSGISLVEKIRAEPALASLPVVVISSAGEAEREELASLGISLFLRKPVTYRDVAGAIRTLLAERIASAASPPSTGGGGAPGGDGRREGLTEAGEVSIDRPDAKPASRR
jgi:CheY-like chemotaxis protein/Tfp pilus assembly protein PilZ